MAQCVVLAVLCFSKVLVPSAEVYIETGSYFIYLFIFASLLSPAAVFSLFRRERALRCCLRVQSRPALGGGEISICTRTRCVLNPNAPRRDCNSIADHTTIRTHKFSPIVLFYSFLVAVTFAALGRERRTGLGVYQDRGGGWW